MLFCIVRSYYLWSHDSKNSTQGLLKGHHRSYDRAKSHMIGQSLFARSSWSSRIFTKPCSTILQLNKHAFWSYKMVFDRAKIVCSITMTSTQISLWITLPRESMFQFNFVKKCKRKIIFLVFAKNTKILFLWKFRHLCRIIRAVNEAI